MDLPADVLIFVLSLCVEGDREVRLIPASVAALAVSLATGMVEVQFWGFTVSIANHAFAADPSETKTKKAVLAEPSGDLLGFEINGKTVALERMFPGIRSTLLLTDEQKQQINAAQRETIYSDAVRTAGASIKSEPGASEEQKAKAREVVGEARKQLLEKVDAILTADQKALVKKLNVAAAESQKAVAETLRGDAKAAKGDNAKVSEMQQRMREPLIADFKSRAAKFLTAEQLAALEKGIEDQRAADERAKNDPKAAKVKKL